MKKFRETLIKILHTILEFLKFWDKKDKQKDESNKPEQDLNKIDSSSDVNQELETNK